MSALERGEGLCRLALHLVAAALTGRAGDVEQTEGHVERAQQALAELESGELHPDLVTLARSIAGEARAVAAAARGRLRDALAELEGASLGPEALREGALLLKRCFLLLAQDRAEEASRALRDLRALKPKLPEALTDRRRVGDALVAAALRRLGVDAHSEGDLSLAQAGDVARRLGDVALLALVSSARAQEAQASGSPQEASLEQAAARAAAGRLVEGLPASLAEGLARTLVPPTHEAVPRASEATSDRELLLAMFGRVLSSKLELQPLLEAVLDALREATGAPRAALALRREGALEVAAAREIPPAELSEGTPRVVLEHVAREGLSARAAGRIPARFAPRSDGLSPPRTLLAVPLSREGQSEPLGAIYLDDPRPKSVLGPDDAALATCFAAQVAAPIQNALGRAPQLGELARVAEAYRETARELGEGGEGASELVGRSQAMRTVQRLIERYGATRAPVTIMGESGTGKELVARALHKASPRRDEPFIVLNCTAVAATLLESELFGVEKGAYTGADRSRKGLFELAHTGTLFLDEVGDMSLEMQAKLLRVLETGELRPVGSRKQVQVDVRIVSATHHDLRELVREGRFREDLLYRLNVLRVELPPLRERREDVLLLCNHFLELVAERNGEPPRVLAPDAAEAVLRHPWPGNVRELRNAIEHAFVTVKGEWIGVRNLPSEIRRAGEAPQKLGAPSHAVEAPPPMTDEAAPDLSPKDLAERTRIVAALREAAGRKTLAASLLGISRVTLWKKIKRLGINPVYTD
ncbi:MAG TPA: hypothetical protein DEA08_30645 [Planctomycetes bacterium]|nr:hypothetical protein [Planctomycetota bacterium]